MSASLGSEAKGDERAPPNTMEDSRASTPRSAGHDRTTPPTELTVSNLGSYEAAIGLNQFVPSRRETQLTNAFGRQVNRLMPFHWWSAASDATKADILMNFCSEHTWQPAEDLDGIFGEPLECGYPAADDCVIGSVSYEVANELVMEAPAPLRSIFTTLHSQLPLAARLRSRVSTLEDEFDLDVVTTGQTILTYRLDEAEHALHSYGIAADRGLLRAIGRCIFNRFVLALMVAYSVPVTEASSLSASADQWQRFIMEFLAELLGASSALDLWRVYERLITELMRRASLTEVCYYAMRPMTVREVALACSQGKLDDLTCAFGGAGNATSVNISRAYYAPISTCTYLVDSTWTADLWRLVYIAVFVLAYCVVFFSAIIAIQCACGVIWYVVRFAASSVQALYSYSLFRRHRSAVELAEVDAHADEAPVQLFRMIGKSSQAFGSLEMSMQGSLIRTSVVVPGCVYLAVVHEEQVTFIGMGFRYQNYLVTAQHNIHAMITVPGKYYVLPFRPDRKEETCDLDTDRMFELTNEILQSDIVADNFPGYDASVIPISQAAWSRLAVKSLDQSDALWNTSVSVYGLERTGKKKLQRSMGAIVKYDDAPMSEVFYSATTLKGWSGSPVLSGQRKVVALHCGTNGEHNRGLNFAYVQLFIDAYEQTLLESSPTAGEEPVYRSKRGRNGRVARRMEELDIEAREDSAIAGYFSRRLRTHQSSNGAIWFVPAAEEEATLRLHKQNWSQISYEDEHAPLPVITQIAVPSEVVKTPSPPSSPVHAKLFNFQPGDPLNCSKNDIRLSTQYFKGLPDDHERYLDMEEAVALGYVPEEYGLPRATDPKTSLARSKVSLSISLDDALTAMKTAKAPSAEMRTEVISLMLDLCKDLRYVVDAQGVTKDKILSQLNSSVVGSSKSPGLPYVNEGFMTNAQLLTKNTPEEIAERSFQSYQAGTWCYPSVNFPKLEPTKKAKLDAGLDRNVQAVGLDSQLYMRCHFAGLVEAATLNYRKSPIMCGWAPPKPGDGQFMYDRMRKKGSRILEYDGKAHEYRAHGTICYEDITDFMIALAVPGEGVTEEMMHAWRVRAKKDMMDLGKQGYQFSDGTVIEKMFAFLLNSGRFDTFIRNSFSVLYWNLVALFEMGYTIEEIKKLFVFTVGGDDVVDVVPSNFDTDYFTEVMAEYGITIHKVKLSTIDDGFEFFSWKFSKNSFGRVQWVPTRFSKHISKLLSTKHEFRAEALVSHMLNWVHSEKHYNFFRDVYLRAQRVGEPGYKISAIPLRMDVISHMRGQESLVRDQSIVQALYVGFA